MASTKPTTGSVPNGLAVTQHQPIDEGSGGGMDFSWTDKQLAFKQSVIQFAQQELCDNIVERDRDGVFSKENWDKCARFGIQGMAIPPEYGGRGMDIMTAMLAMEGLGYGCPDNGLTLGLNAQMWTIQLSILHSGTQGQKEKYLPPLCNGRMIAAHGITEPEAGSDVYSLTTTATKRDGGYVLSGTKTLITLAPIADLFLIFATTDPALGMWGITAFLIEKDAPGLHASEPKDKMGLRTLPFGEVILTDCFVPTEQRLGPEGGGVSISNNSLEWERSCMLASQLGAMERQLEATIRFARNRKQFGKPIGKFQSVSNRIADMKLRLETARLLIYKVAWLKKAGKSAVMEAALAKLYFFECFVQSSLDAIRTHGGKGYLTECEIERDMRDAIGGIIYGGTSDIQRNIVARLLGL